jgi:hypothetical protein
MFRFESQRQEAEGRRQLAKKAKGVHQISKETPARFLVGTGRDLSRDFK